MSAITTPFAKAVIFDAYGTRFDVHAVIAAAEQMLPSHGDALSRLWPEADRIHAVAHARSTGRRARRALPSVLRHHARRVALRRQHITAHFGPRGREATVRAYQPSLGTQAFGAKPRELVFVSLNGWNVAGASRFGFTTFWLNRQIAAAEELGMTPHRAGRGMNALLVFLQSLAASDRNSSTGSTGHSGGNRTRHGPGA